MSPPFRDSGTRWDLLDALAQLDAWHIATSVTPNPTAETGQPGRRNNAAQVFENVRCGAKTLPLPESQIRFLPILLRIAPVQPFGHPFGESPNEQARNHFLIPTFRIRFF